MSSWFVFENFDILMETPQVFAERIRVARNHIQKRKQSSDYLNMNDFDIIPLFPLNFWIYNSTTTPTNFNLEDELSNLLLSDLVANTTLQNLTCTHSIVHDSRVIERMHGVMDFTPKQLSWSFQFMNLTFNPSYNYTFLYRVLQKYQTDYSTLNGNVTLSTSQIDTLLWPSSCHYCLTTGCTAENWRYNDSLDFVIFCLGFVFYTCLFVTRAFKSPVIYRKYGIVFVGPVLIMGTYLSMVNAFNNTCLELGVMFTVYLAMLLNTIYLFTILRYFYLRSLYEIVKRVKYPRFFKFLASDTIGFVVTLILPIPLCLIFVTPVAVIFPNYESIPYNTAINITIALSCGLSCIAGVVFVSYEMVKNRKAILKFGFLRFLIFEDPFYFRVDLISMAVVLILLILLAVIFLIEPKSL
ncbi:hypothetical protein C9374_001883 [Naegleria lovaniensis]|uniref:Transmembrane protein n=1 Tax=Naegleria lovaniensis TaxID=51637 RepID=A0AA88GVW0_NAELO|nr:uncharacterized protein C9374_001883 [Naegleria lovaniensis]KAG2386848.1 hypothetical protein C9374_001883 [Naegleria lovaniensis]